MGWIIALLILIGICVLPVGVDLWYGEKGVRIRLAVGFFRFTLIPGKKREKKTKETRNKKEAASPAPEKKAERSADSGGSLLDFIPLVKLVLRFLGGVRKGLCIDDLYLRLVLAGDDPYALAMNYGRAQAGIYGLQTALERWVHIRERDLEIECSFTASETKVAAGMAITIPVGTLVSLAAVYGCRIVIEFLKIRKMRKGGKKNESKAS